MARGKNAFAGATQFLTSAKGARMPGASQKDDIAKETGAVPSPLESEAFSPAESEGSRSPVTSQPAADSKDVPEGSINPASLARSETTAPVEPLPARRTSPDVPLDDSALDKERLPEPDDERTSPPHPAGRTREETPFTVEEIPLEAIVLPGWNVRREIDGVDAFDNLIASIRTVGLLQPVVVNPDPDDPGKYRLVSGERRYTAVRELGWSTIPAHIIQTASQRMLQAIMLAENLHRENLSVMEEADGYHRLESLGMSRHEIADLVNKSRAYIIVVLKIANTDTLRRYIDAEMITPRQAQEVASLVHKNQEKVPGAIEWICEWIPKTKPSISTLRHKIAEIKAAGKLPEVIPPQRRILHTLADREIAHFADIRGKLMKQPPVVLSALVEQYERMVTETRSLLMSANSQETTGTD